MKKLLLLIVILLSGVFYTFVSAKEKVFTIYLDAGHGGDDSGANAFNVREDEINLNVTLNLYERLTSVGYKVYLTRDGDYDLAPDGSKNRKRDDIHKRVDLINNSDCDMYISIHANAIHSPIWRGAQVFYRESETNAKFGKIMQDNFVSILKNTDRLAKSISGKYLVDHVNKMGLLIELGFISNPEEAMLLNTKEYQAMLSYVIFVGIVDYLNN